MLVKELPEGTNLRNVKVKLPEYVLKLYQDYCGGEPEMWIGGSIMGDFFMTPNPPNLEGEKRLYPMPVQVEPEHILEWEVVEILKEVG